MCGNFFNRKFSSVAVCFFLCSLLFLACGLEALYYLEPPTGSTVEIGNEDRTLDVFNFYTGDNSDVGSDFDYKGTSVYYKIFADENTAKTMINTIYSHNNSSDISAAASYIVNEDKGNYKPLLSTSSSSDPLIKQKGSVHVRIRLSRYGSEAEYQNGIFINGVLLGYPKRFFDSGKYGFEFSKDLDTDINPIPTKNDGDVSMTTSNDSGNWYVDVWAFSYGRDNNYSPSYSKVLHLGCVKISESYYTK